MISAKSNRHWLENVIFRFRQSFYFFGLVKNDCDRSGDALGFCWRKRIKGMRLFNIGSAVSPKFTKRRSTGNTCGFSKDGQHLILCHSLFDFFNIRSGESSASGMDMHCGGASGQEQDHEREGNDFHYLEFSFFRNVTKIITPLFDSVGIFYGQ
jgi:hypothetical protein